MTCAKAGPLHEEREKSKRKKKAIKTPFVFFGGRNHSFIFRREKRRDEKESGRNEKENVLNQITFMVDVDASSGRNGDSTRNCMKTRNLSFKMFMMEQCLGVEKI